MRQRSKDRLAQRRITYGKKAVDVLMHLDYNNSGSL